MVNAVVHRHVLDFKRIDAFQAADVIAVLFGIRPALMMGVNAADGAEVMLRGHGVELVEPQRILALDDPDAGKRNRGDYRALSPADRAVAPARVNDAVRQVEFQHDSTAVACCQMFRVDNGSSNLLDHDDSSFCFMM
jgi:hypothetical protein